MKALIDFMCSDAPATPAQAAAIFVVFAAVVATNLWIGERLFGSEDENQDKKETGK